MSEYQIAVIPGDGIGPEIMEAALSVLRAVESPELSFQFESHPIGAAHYARTGEILPSEVIDSCRNSDAIFLAAIGLPEVRLADGTEVQPQIVVGLRKALDLYAAVRPIKLYPGVSSPLADTSKGINFVVLRENTEGMFASFNGGGSVQGEVATDTMVITRKGTARIAEYAFRLAKRRNGRPSDWKSLVTCVDKANVFRSLAFFREIFDEVAATHPDVEHDHVLVDALSLYLVQDPSAFDVLVMENFLGDIISDLAAAIVGGLGLGPSAEIGDDCALFQPSHGSAPPLAGRNVANPLATILSGAMMLDWLGEQHDDHVASAAGAHIDAVVARVLQAGTCQTPDLGGSASTSDMAQAVIAAL